MKTPNTLPFYLQNGDYLDILDNEDVIIATINTHQNDKEIGEYIVNAANNYPKAIELLKMFNFLAEATYGKKEFKKWVESQEYQKFLKQIKNDN